MKYFLDTEFIEGFHKSLLGKKRHFIDLVSIGIYCEDGREYHAISNEWNFKDADSWVQENVLVKLYLDTVHGDNRNRYGANTFHKAYGKSNATISEEILRFFGCWRDQHFWRAPEGIEVYAYFADYDWVLFCSLFGRMIDLPKGFPMYCNDLKQTLDEVVKKLDWQYGRDIWANGKRSLYTIGKGDCQEKDRPATFDEKIKVIKELSEYPKQENEHNALADAKWNYELFKFLNTIK